MQGSLPVCVHLLDGPHKSFELLRRFRVLIHEELSDVCLGSVGDSEETALIP